jgi:NTE family protein
MLKGHRYLLSLLAALTLSDCFHPAKPTTPASPAILPPAPVRLKIGLALSGGAAKGFAHIGVIKMLEASGMDAFQLQQTAFGLDETKIRDVRLFSGGLIQGQALQDYVNQLVGQRPIERLKIPFAAVATELETGQRTVFVHGNTG